MKPVLYIAPSVRPVLCPPFIECQSLCYRCVEEAACNFPHPLRYFWESAFSKSRFGFSSSVKFGSTSAAFAFNARRRRLSLMSSALNWSVSTSLARNGKNKSILIAPGVYDLQIDSLTSLFMGQNLSRIRKTWLHPFSLPLSISENAYFLWLESLFQITFSCFCTWTSSNI